LYDSRPQQIKFFDHIGRKIEKIYAGSTVSAALARSSSNNKASPLEVYVWGYLHDGGGRITKATQPVLVQHALTFDKIKSLFLSPVSDLGVLGIKNDKYFLQIYSQPGSGSVSLPHSPFYEDAETVDQIFTEKPFCEIGLGDIKEGLSRFTVGNGESYVHA
jgi:hypothetical protein